MRIEEYISGLATQVATTMSGLQSRSESRNPHLWICRHLHASPRPRLQKKRNYLPSQGIIVLRQHPRITSRNRIPVIYLATSSDLSSYFFSPRPSQILYIELIFVFALFVTITKDQKCAKMHNSGANISCCFRSLPESIPTTPTSLISLRMTVIR